MRHLTFLPALIAVGCLVPVSFWWFTQMFVLAGNVGTATHSQSVQAVQVILLLQFLSISLFAPQFVTDAKRESTQQIKLQELSLALAAFVLPAWPFLAMLQLASGRPPGHFAQAEVAVLAVGLAVTVVAHGLRRCNFGSEISRLSQNFLGLGAASLVWVYRQEIFMWVGL